MDPQPQIDDSQELTDVTTPLADAPTPTTPPSATPQPREEDEVTSPSTHSTSQHWKRGKILSAIVHRRITHGDRHYYDTAIRSLFPGDVEDSDVQAAISDFEGCDKVAWGTGSKIRRSTALGLQDLLKANRRRGKARKHVVSGEDLRKRKAGRRRQKKLAHCRKVLRSFIERTVLGVMMSLDEPEPSAGDGV